MKAIQWFLMLLLINTGFLDAQDLEQKYSSQLTSNIWMEGKEHIVAFKFNADGTFFKTLQSQRFKPVDFMGKWEWLSQDTFAMQTTQKIIDGQIKDLNPEPYHKRVIVSSPEN